MVHSMCPVVPVAYVTMVRPYTSFMAINVELSDAVSVRLSAEAARRGVGIDQVIADLAESLPPGFDPARPTSPTLAFIAAGQSKTGITGRIDELLADGFGRD